MPIVTPKTNFIDLLEDLLDFLASEDPSDRPERARELFFRCDKALGELENLQDEV